MQASFCVAGVAGVSAVSFIPVVACVPALAGFPAVDGVFVVARFPACPKRKNARALPAPIAAFSACGARI